MAEDRAAAAVAEATAALAAKQAAVSRIFLENRTTVDKVTPDLRRRIFEATDAGPRKSLPPSVLWMLVAGVSFLLSLSVGSLIFQL